MEFFQLLLLLLPRTSGCDCGSCGLYAIDDILRLKLVFNVRCAAVKIPFTIHMWIRCLPVSRFYPVYALMRGLRKQISGRHLGS